MEIILDILERYKKPPKIITRLSWQIEALDFMSKLSDPNSFKGSIFKAYKDNIGIARIAALDTLELNKPYSRYFLKVYSSIRSKQNQQR